LRANGNDKGDIRGLLQQCCLLNIMYKMTELFLRVGRSSLE
jgi:hypothetical protein